MKTVKKFQLNKNLFGKKAGSILRLKCDIDKDKIVIQDFKWERIWKDSKIDHTLSLLTDEIKHMKEKVEPVQKDKVKGTEDKKNKSSKNKLKK